MTRLDRALTRLVRSPWVWALLALVGVLVGLVVVFLPVTVLAGIIKAALVLITVFSLAFIALMGNPNHHHDPAIVWHLDSFAAFTAIEATSLVLLAQRVPVPIWVFALAYVGQMVVTLWRLFLAFDGRRNNRKEAPPHDVG